jgi:ABC-type branched-subunit amino acid transport system substrate-binding protein
MQTSCRPLTWNSSDGGAYPRSFDVAGVIGPLLSTVAVAVSQVLSVFHIPVLGLKSTANTLSDKTQYPYFMRIVPPDLAEERAMLEVRNKV